MFTAKKSDTTNVSFTIRAEAEPSVLPKLLEPLAVFGLCPARFGSSLDAVRGELHIIIEVQVQSAETAHRIAKRMGRVLGVRSVLSSPPACPARDRRALTG